jgi:hypothetical protein
MASTDVTKLFTNMPERFSASIAQSLEASMPVGSILKYVRMPQGDEAEPLVYDRFLIEGYENAWQPYPGKEYQELYFIKIRPLDGDYHTGQSGTTTHKLLVGKLETINERNSTESKRNPTWKTVDARILMETSG